MSGTPLKDPDIYTIGHSVRPIDEFIDILKVHRIALIADVRTIPRSRRNPQFAQEALALELEKEGIGYRHLKALGGLRRARADSPNQGWRNSAFRGFADYMQTGEFADALQELIDMAGARRTAVMCAEAVPWRCHRFLIADALVIRGIRVGHITGKSHPRPHRLTPFAKIEGLKITYTPEQEQGDLFEQ